MKRQYPVINSESATRDYNKKYLNFQEILAKVRPIQPVCHAWLLSLSTNTITGTFNSIVSSGMSMKARYYR